MKIALATSASWPDLGPSDALALRALRARGHDAIAAVWNTPQDWSTFDAVVIRSTWDYHLRLPEFRAWIDALPVPLFNPPRQVFWNSNKRYLLELAGQGFPVVPSRFIPAIDDTLFAALGSDRLVVKPAVSASAFQTRIVQRGDAELIVQPFIDAIAGGEWSIIFLDGALSHEVLKRPAAGDFRVQQELGGSAVRADAPAEVRALAERLVDSLPERPLYARVDIVMTPSGPLLMELELIEPELFFDLAPQSLDTFCDALERRLT
jgi:glutathione synthase/RimK-type ligase-like ATP-grasp enzyme